MLILSDLRKIDAFGTLVQNFPFRKAKK